MSHKHEEPETVLSRFLKNVFGGFYKTKTSYCVFGNYDQLPYFTTNDVDIWVEDYTLAENILLDVAKEQDLRLLLVNKTVSGCNFFFSDSSRKEFIHIDLMCQIAWRSIVPIFSNEMINERINHYNNICVADEVLTTVGHLIYPLLTHGVIKEKYRLKIQDLCIDSDEFEKILIEMLGEKMAINIIENGRQADWDSLRKTAPKLKKLLIARNILENPLKTIKQFMIFIASHIYRVFRPSGLCVAFVGNDGCGKSTIVNELRSMMGCLGVRENSKLFYWRPFLFPQIRKVLLMDGNKNKASDEYTEIKKKYSVSVSVVKYIYYVMDYIVGGLINRLKISRGGIHFYDRHYDDLIVYPERFGMTLPKGLANKIRFLVPQPDIIFFLHSRPEVIKKRKDEMYDEELDRQIEQYKSLVSTYSNYKIINGEESIGVVRDNVVSVIVDCLEEKSARTSYLDRR